MVAYVPLSGSSFEALITLGVQEKKSYGEIFSILCQHLDSDDERLCYDVVMPLSTTYIHSGLLTFRTSSNPQS